ncbi:G1 S-specific cyclin CLN1 [Fusarium agapanthi]|uniref:G1 S-specific cyclin CLN1 n=1 Tax=Fusarium agapanthi TaxID=1803897 RepID=A0A9P5EHU0_9HYPO|nr:G1 S-specific cyclin CLN1 [Fusarium agapanthi]
MATCPEAQKNQLDFSKNPGLPLSGSDTSPDVNHGQVQALRPIGASSQEGSEYLEEIIQHLAYMENATLPSLPMIEMQTQITWQMRSSLIDFVVRSHQYFRLPSQVLFLSVNLIDRYCSTKQIDQQYYLLLGSAALWIASKYGDKTYQVEDFKHPSVKEIGKLCNGIFDGHMIVQMEKSVLCTLGWVLGHPTIDHYIKLLLVGESESKELTSMAAYLSEVSLYHRDFVGVKPSIIAESCCMLAKVILYGSLSIGANTEDEVMKALKSLWKLVQQPPTTIADKYSRQSRSYVAQRVFSCSAS